MLMPHLVQSFPRMPSTAVDASRPLDCGRALAAAGLAAGAPELARQKRVTLQLLWFEYREAHRDRYQYRRNHRCFSVSEVREAIAPLLAALNERPFQKIEGSRRSLFEDLDRPALKPLPAERYEYAEWRKARVNIDYHMQVDGRFYGVPTHLRAGRSRSGSAPGPIASSNV